jgi:hypothetical protein
MCMQSKLDFDFESRFMINIKMAITGRHDVREAESLADAECVSRLSGEICKCRSTVLTRCMATALECT